MVINEACAHLGETEIRTTRVQHKNLALEEQTGTIDDLFFKVKDCFILKVASVLF